MVRRGLHVSCELGPPCKVKSDRFAVTVDMKVLISLSHCSKNWNENGMKTFDLCFTRGLM